jgi:alkylation response protein AidB-like acyl-CoA dehydrogenase
MAPPLPGEERTISRGSFILTEPIPYVGADAAMLSGRISIAEWEPGQEPILLVEKRGRFITNMDFANFATVAVETGDERIRSSCMVIVEETDPGTFDRGAPTKKMVHQLSSTRDPVLRLRVPASRIIGGYTIEDGKIVPRYSHSEVIDAVFRRTRIAVGLMTSAKLISAIEPVIRYQRGRFRGGQGIEEGSPRYEMGLQQKEDSLHRLADIWAAGEASASLGFEAARLFDRIDPFEARKEEIFAEQGIKGTRGQLKAFKKLEKDAIEYISLLSQPEHKHDAQRFTELAGNELIQFILLNAQGNVVCPACKLWNTGHGATMMREALSLMGGYGITEDCPGFLCQKWMDAQLEATYEGPEAVQRRQLTITMCDPVFLAWFRVWTQEMRQIASENPGTGACTLATAMQVWLWTLNHLQEAKDADGKDLYHGTRQGVTFALADILCEILATRYLILDVLELEKKGPENAALADGLPGIVSFYKDLCHVHSSRAAGEVGRVCAELVYGYQRHPAWDDENYKGCYTECEVEELEGIMPGIIGIPVDVVASDGSHPVKAGPCARVDHIETFTRLRAKLDCCLTGARLAKDRVAYALTQVAIPEALDYPQ